LKEGEELWYNDALKLMLKDKKDIFAVEIKNGKFYDTGNKMEYLKTVVEFALRHPGINGEFKKYLSSLDLS
jgi:UTP--glucose-1-phosphate uridylyltransferase